jgi:hypothetical protein
MSDTTSAPQLTPAPSQLRTINCEFCDKFVSEVPLTCSWSEPTCEIHRPYVCYTIADKYAPLPTAQFIDEHIKMKEQLDKALREIQELRSEVFGINNSQFSVSSQILHQLPVANSFTDARVLSKVLDDLRDCFNAEVKSTLSERALMVARTVVEVAYDIANDDSSRDEFQAFVNSEIFGFNADGKTEFLKALKKTDRTKIKYYEELATQRAQTLLDARIDISLCVICEGSSQHDTIIKYNVLLKAGITVNDFFEVCRMFMKHSRHSIAEIACIDEKTVQVAIDESDCD